MRRWLIILGCALPGSVLGQPAAPATAPPPPPPPPPPVLTAPVTACSPGGMVRVPGRRLGNGGRVKVYGLSKGISARVQRGDNGIAFRMPDDIKGEVDHRIQIVYLRNGTRRSNTVPCTFRARRATRTLKLSEFTLAMCGEDSKDSNTSMGGLASCRHTGAQRTGRDVWRVPGLVNGWKIKRVIFEDVSAGGGSATLKEPAYAAGKAADLAVEWSAGGEHAEYRLAVRLQGPLGVSPFPKATRKADRKQP